MKSLSSCEFNIDTACVELKYLDGSMISIDTIAVENELDATMLQRGEIDWLLYNKPLEYADLILNGDIEDYIKVRRNIDLWNKRRRIIIPCITGGSD